MDNNYVICNGELYHWGVKGMRWGVRKSKSSSFSSNTKKKSSKSEDHIRAKTLKKKKLSQMSNAEIKELNTRLQLESQYKNLKRQNVSAGKKFVKDVAYEAAKNTASDYARKYAKQGIEFLIKSNQRKDSGL